MFKNILVALSNAPAVLSIKRSYIAHDYITTGSIVFVASMSFLSPLVENHKHGMTGIGFTRNISYILNRLDVLGCIIVTLRFGYLYYNKHGFVLPQHIISYCLPICLNVLSEYDKTPSTQTLYMISHIAWHISIFTMMSHFLIVYIY